VVCIDNVTRPIDSAALCSVLTQEFYQDRVLGVSQMAQVLTSVLWLATGNNMVFEGDLISRVIPCDLDPGCEKPEERRFDIDLRKYIPEHRASLVPAALTVIHAYQLAGSPDQGLPEFGRFEQWSKWVRSALVWCGEADPCEGRKRLEDVDPVVRRLRAVLQSWHGRLGVKTVTVAEAIAAAETDASVGKRDFLDALMGVASGKDGRPDAQRIGSWLLSQQKRLDLGLRFERVGSRSGVALWQVARAMADPSSVGLVGLVGPSNPSREEWPGDSSRVWAETLPPAPRAPREEGESASPAGSTVAPEEAELDEEHREQQLKVQPEQTDSADAGWGVV
jgi:hypothetical protein